MVAATITMSMDGASPSPGSPAGSSWPSSSAEDEKHCHREQIGFNLRKKKRKAGRKKFQETRHPVYRGVRQRNSKWVCELRQPNSKKSRVWLGTFSCPDVAARAYDVAAFALRGDSALLNFPEEVNALPRVPSPSSIELIRCTAVEAAEAFAEGKDSRSSRSSLPPNSTSSCMDNAKMGPEVWRRPVYMDEEELFNMPGLLDSMAEGLIVTPPAMKRGFNWDEEPVAFSLWSD